MGRNNKKNSSNYIVQGSILAIAGILVRIIGVFYRVPVTNIIGDTGNGSYGYAYEIYSVLLLVSSIGIPVAISKMVSARMAKGQAKNAFRVFKSAMVFSVVIGGICGLIMVIFAQPLSGKYPESVYALRVLGPTIFILAIISVLRGYFQGVGTVVPTAFSQIAEQIVNAIVSVVAAYYLFDYGSKVIVSAADGDFAYAPAYGAAGATLGTLSGALTALVFLVFVFMLYRRVIKRQMRRDRTVELDSYQDIYRTLIVTIIPITLSVVVYNVTNLLDSVVFGNIQSLQGVSKDSYTALWGIYSGKFRMLMNVPLSIASCLTPALIPNITASMINHDMDGIRTQVHTSVRYTMVITIPCTIGLMALAGPVLILLFVDDSALAAQVLFSGAVMIPFFAYSTLGNGILQGINQLKAPIYNGLIALAAHLVFLAAVMFVFKDSGIFAVILANLFFGILMCFLNARSINRHLGYKQEYRKSIVLPLIGSLVMGAAAYIVYFGCNKLFRRFAGVKLSNMAAVFIAIVIAVIIYAVFLLKSRGITEEELKGFPKGHLLTRYAKKLHLL